ncbi:MAG: adenylate cyclase [Planctomycetota bacterium]|jgi:adenylate cyclase
MENEKHRSMTASAKTASFKKSSWWRGITRPGVPTDSSAEAIKKKLNKLYIQASGVAILITMLLAICGLEFTNEQWALMLIGVSVGVPAYLIPDLIVLRRQFAPVYAALKQLDQGADPADPATRELMAEGLVRALNLPYLFFLRINFLHGPLATLLVAVVLFVANQFFDGGYETWQFLLLSFSILFFASPAHAIYEYFALSRVMIPVVERLWQTQTSLDPVWQAKIKSIRLRSKLFYLSIFMTAVPLAFLAWSTLYKTELLWDGTNLPLPDEFDAIVRWAAGIVLVSISLVLIIGYLLAVDVTHGADNLGEAMKMVRKGKLDVELRVAGTDEYADLYRGFNHMTTEIRDELKIHAITHELAGVINLDTLISKIMNAASELLDAERSTLFLFDEEKNELWSRFAEGLDTKEIRFPANAGIAGTVLTTGEVENISDPYSDPRFNQEIDKQTGFTTRSILCVPIVHKRGTRIGVAQILNKRGGSFGATDEARLQSFAAQISASLENARLFQGVLEMKNYSDAILRSTTDGIMTLNRDGRIVTANAAALQILQCTEREIIGRDSADYFGNGNDWVLSSVERVKETGDPDLVLDVDYTNANGSSSVNLRTTELVDGADESLGFLLAFEDMTGEKRLKTTMSRYMSKEVADQLLESGAEALTGRSQKVTILFSDIRGFTTLSEELGARETVAMLNEYFEIMVDIVHRRGGILDKYIGDAIMALWGAPFENPQDADEGVHTANEMMTKLRELNIVRQARGAKSIDIGVGLCTGEVVAGNIGSPKRLDYTAVGDHVNIAARLEGATKLYGAGILLSEFVVADLKEEHLIREVDLIRVKGKNRPVRVYEALDYLVPQAGPQFEQFLEHYAAALKLSRSRQWSEAIEMFNSTLELRPTDVTSKLHLARCQAYLESPPADDWDGVWVMETK